MKPTETYIAGATPGFDCQPMQLVKQEVLLRPARRAALFSLLVSVGFAGSMLAGRIG
jgi:hypothetical protein